MNLLMTLNETANSLGIGKTKTYELVREGELELVKIGAKSLITHESIIAFIKKISAAGHDNR